MEKNKPSVSDLKQYLKDAGSYDATLNNNEMYELYEALELSKNTVLTDNENRSSMEKPELNRSIIEDLRKNSVVVDNTQESTQSSPDSFNLSDEEMKLVIDNLKASTTTPSKTFSKLSDNSSNNNTLLNINKNNDFSNIDAYNAIPTMHEPLCKGKMNPIYKFPYYCRPEVLTLNYTEKEPLIEEFHNKLLNDLHCRQLQSLHYVPWGSSIKSNCNFNGSLNRKLEEAEKTEDSDFSESNANDLLEMFFPPIDDQSNNEKPETTKLPPAQQLDEPPKSPIPTPVRKRPNLSTLKNEDIIKRSKLFLDSPSRSEKLFNELVESERNKKVQQQEIDLFKETLDQHDNEENVDDDNLEIINVEEPFQRRRIVPPSYKKNKRGGRGRRNVSKVVNKNRDSTSESVTPYTPLETKSPSTRKAVKKGTCPLCNEQLLQNELEIHAASCGEKYESVDNNVTIKKHHTPTITCEVCDKVFPLNTEYEVHVKECIDKRS